MPLLKLKVKPRHITHKKQRHRTCHLCLVLYINHRSKHTDRALHRHRRIILHNELGNMERDTVTQIPRVAVLDRYRGTGNHVEAVEGEVRSGRVLSVTGVVDEHGAAQGEVGDAFA